MHLPPPTGDVDDVRLAAGSRHIVQGYPQSVASFGLRRFSVVGQPADGGPAVPDIDAAFEWTIAGDYPDRVQWRFGIDREATTAVIVERRSNAQSETAHAVAWLSLRAGEARVVVERLLPEWDSRWIKSVVVRDGRCLAVADQQLAMLRLAGDAIVIDVDRDASSHPELDSWRGTLSFDGQLAYLPSWSRRVVDPGEPTRRIRVYTVDVVRASDLATVASYTTDLPVSSMANSESLVVFGGSTGVTVVDRACR